MGRVLAVSALTLALIPSVRAGTVAEAEEAARAPI